MGSSRPPEACRDDVLARLRTFSFLFILFLSLFASFLIGKLYSSLLRKYLCYRCPVALLVLSSSSSTSVVVVASGLGGKEGGRRRRRPRWTVPAWCRLWVWKVQRQRNHQPYRDNLTACSYPVGGGSAVCALVKPSEACAEILVFGYLGVLCGVLRIMVGCSWASRSGIWESAMTQPSSHLR